MTQEFLVSIGRYANRNSMVSRYFLLERRKQKTGKMVLRESINHHKDPVDAAFMQKKT